MRAAIVMVVACMSAVGLCAGQDVQASIKKSTNIPAQELMPALKTLAHERGFQVAFLAEVVGNKRTQGAVGDLTTTEALTKLLEGTNLVYSYLDDKTVTILPVNSNNKLDQQGPSAGNSQHCSGISSNKLDYATSQNQTASGSTAIGWTGSDGASDCAESYSKENQRLASAVAGAAEEPVQSSDADSSLNKDSTDSSKIQEIVVTAQKRSESVQDVPVPVSVIDAAALTDSAQLRVQDYYHKIPGLGLALMSDGSEPTIVIRGVTTGGFTNTTVGIVVDEVPYGGTITPGSSPSPPDIDPGDLARVEVLRGPQGTLYGASSMGGLLKFVTVDPSTDAMRGSVSAGFASVHDGETGYTMRGSLNVPVGDTFAVRASAFTIRDPGYVDNLQTGEDDVNRRKNEGGRLSALWRPSANFSLKLGAIIQDSDRLGTQDVDVALGNGLEQRMIPGTGVYGRQTEAYSATMIAKVGSIDLVSATGYNNDKLNTAIDQSAAFGTAANTNFGVGGVAGPFMREIDKFSQELRASVPIGDRVDWLFGAFYTAEDLENHLRYWAADPTTGAKVGALYISDTFSTFDEYAAFTNLTVDFTERFDIQFGARLSENEQTFTTRRSGPLSIAFFGVSPSVVPEKTSKDTSVFTYLVTPRFRVSPDLMAYARLASGYRPGGPNTGCGIPTVPCQFDPDTTRNYEIGVKGNLLDRLLSFDASFYYIDWQDIQFSLTIGGFGYQDNAARAKSQGVELSVESKPLPGLTVSAWGSWNEAELTEGFPAAAVNVSGHPGDRLPYSSRFSGNLSLDQKFPVGKSTGFVGATVSYVGDRKGIFRRATQVRETFPSYTQLDLHAGLKYDTWTVNAFVTNLTDERGILRSGLDALRPTFRTFTQPRTIGASVTKNF